MKIILSAWFLTLCAVEVCFAGSPTNEVKAFLCASIGKVKGHKENLDTKKSEAEEICDKINSLQPKTDEDATLLVQFLTIADPREAGGGLKSPSVVFPAVGRLLLLGQVGAEAVLDAVKYTQVNETQTALNIAYVLSHTIGAEKGMALIRSKEQREKLTAQQLETLHKAINILLERSATKTSKPSK